VSSPDASSSSKRRPRGPRQPRQGGEGQRRTQEERSARTRERLLDATVDCLIDRGYAGTTTLEVAARAGLSRGAQLHHFPTRTELVVSAVSHLAKRRAEELSEQASALGPGPGRIDELLEVVWASLSGPLFYASLELWIAARTDTDLHEHVYEFQRGVSRFLHELWRERVEGPAPDFQPLVELTLHLVRGMALQKILRDDDSERRRLFDLWKQLVSAHLQSVARTES